MTFTEKTGDPAAPLLPQPPPPPPSSAQTCYGVPAATSSVAVFQDPYFPEPQAYVLLPVYPSHRRRRRPRCCGCFRCVGSLVSSSTLLSLAFFLLLLLSAAFFLWPSEPDLTVARLDLDDIRVDVTPDATICISMGVKIRIRNPAFFALNYRSIVVSLGYRGRQLGFVTSSGGHIRARGVSYIHAKLKLDGIGVLSDAIYLVEDLARGSLPLGTITEVKGRMRLFFFDVPVEGKVSCTVTVNPSTQKVIHQDCYLQ
ncbi:uncharacterized protein LOC122001262 [Zingiber officinale]|uniref:Late embryogenesis abundant protein LEA-2 subgroup domain-containing protein n=1 Tax=Zingiber officinale TaxID=94328 RepID=A0A8J5FRC2_ZINOF|nr:uncharacterized protein LOC122001262 [Zingiber officinale]KAG6492384.1 hypothetical protein ZIOFF_047347 [Zingiber officinale]